MQSHGGKSMVSPKAMPNKTYLELYKLFQFLNLAAIHPATMKVSPN
jgi:hypothetical protein